MICSGRRWRGEREGMMRMKERHGLKRSLLSLWAWSCKKSSHPFSLVCAFIRKTNELGKFSDYDHIIWWTYLFYMLDQRYLKISWRPWFVKTYSVLVWFVICRINVCKFSTLWFDLVLYLESSSKQKIIVFGNKQHFNLWKVF